MAVINRVGHVLLWAGVIWSISTARIHVPSLVRGLALGLVVGALYGLLFISSSSYAWRFTGVLGDPNTAGLALVSILPVVIFYIRGEKKLPFVVAVVFLAIIATLSRTTWLAFLVVSVWMFFGARIPRHYLLIGMAPLVWWYTKGVEFTAATGIFASRAGSDVLREEIIMLEHQKIDRSPWVGQGLGEATVTIEDAGSFFFHNGYLAVQAEGGLVALGLVIALYVIAFCAVPEVYRSGRSVYLEAALLAVAVCALNLGEVFFSYVTAVVLGVLICVSSAVRSRGSTDVPSTFPMVRRSQRRVH